MKVGVCVALAVLAVPPSVVSAQADQGCATSARPAEPVAAPPHIMRGFMSGAMDEHTFPDMRSWGANIVRLQLHPVFVAQQHKMPLWQAWAIVLDSVEADVKAAYKNGIFSVVDLHEAPVEDPADHESAAFWNDPKTAEAFCRAWRDLATRLLPLRHDIWGYDLYNEPLDRPEMPNAPSQWRPIAEKIIRTIRSVDRQTWIIYEPGPGFSFGGFRTLKPFDDRRVIYSAHSYEPLAFTSQGLNQPAHDNVVHYPGIRSIEQAVAPAVAFQDKYHVPIYVGEFSVIRWAPHAEAVDYLRDNIKVFEEHHWSWTYHAFREFNGWSLEHGDEFYKPGTPPPPRITDETDRGRVVRAGLEKNNAP